MRNQLWERKRHAAAACRYSWSTMVNWVQAVFFVWWRVAWLFNSFAAPRRSERQARLPQRVKQPCSVRSRFTARCDALFERPVSCGVHADGHMVAVLYVIRPAAVIWRTATSLSSYPLLFAQVGTCGHR
jgi:hypothetical protein